MKKIQLLCGAIISATMVSCIGMAPATTGGTTGRQPNPSATHAETPASTQQPASQAPMQDLLSVLANSAVAQSGQNNSLIGNLLASVTGNLTTTQANLVGTWVYSAPSVQFESENLLSQAGGTTVATSLENKLQSIYNMVGIAPGKMAFQFSADGKVNYILGSRVIEGTYTFDRANKMITIMGPSGRNPLKAYVTVSGNSMSLCFDSSKVLGLFSSLSSQLSGYSNTMSNIGSLAGNYNGMKTGFKFVRQ